MKMIMKVLLAVSSLALMQAAPRQRRLSLAEPMPSYYYSNIDGNPDLYEFGYDIVDPKTGDTQYRSEQRFPNGTVVGHYGYTDPTGLLRSYKYIADEGGYRVRPDLPSPAPIPKPLLSNEQAESSITWTRPPKKPKKKITITNDFVSKLGILFGRANII